MKSLMPVLTSTVLLLALAMSATAVIAEASSFTMDSVSLPSFPSSDALIKGVAFSPVNKGTLLITTSFLRNGTGVFSYNLESKELLQVVGNAGSPTMGCSSTAVSEDPRNSPQQLAPFVEVLSEDDFLYLSLLPAPRVVQVQVPALPSGRAALGLSTVGATGIQGQVMKVSTLVNGESCMYGEAPAFRAGRPSYDSQLYQIDYTLYLPHEKEVLFTQRSFIGSIAKGTQNLWLGHKTDRATRATFDNHTVYRLNTLTLYPMQMTLSINEDQESIVYFVEGGTGTVRQVDQSGVVRPFMGAPTMATWPPPNCTRSSPCDLEEVWLSYPKGIAVLNQTTLFVADGSLGVIYMVRHDIDQAFVIAGSLLDVGSTVGPLGTNRIAGVHSLTVGEGFLYFVSNRLLLRVQLDSVQAESQVTAIIPKHLCDLQTYCSGRAYYAEGNPATSCNCTCLRGYMGQTCSERDPSVPLLTSTAAKTASRQISATFPDGDSGLGGGQGGVAGFTQTVLPEKTETLAPRLVVQLWQISDSSLQAQTNNNQQRQRQQPASSPSSASSQSSTASSTTALGVLLSVQSLDATSQNVEVACRFESTGLRATTTIDSDVSQACSIDPSGELLCRWAGVYPDDEADESTATFTLSVPSYFFGTISVSCQASSLNLEAVLSTQILSLKPGQPFEIPVNGTFSPGGLIGGGGAGGGNTDTNGGAGNQSLTTTSSPATGATGDYKGIFSSDSQYFACLDPIFLGLIPFVLFVILAFCYKATRKCCLERPVDTHRNVPLWRSLMLNHYWLALLIPCHSSCVVGHVLMWGTQYFLFVLAVVGLCRMTFEAAAPNPLVYAIICGTIAPMLAVALRPLYSFYYWAWTTNERSNIKSSHESQEMTTTAPTVPPAVTADSQNKKLYQDDVVELANESKNQQQGVSPVDGSHSNTNTAAPMTNNSFAGMISNSSFATLRNQSFNAQPTIYEDDVELESSLDLSDCGDDIEAPPSTKGDSTAAVASENLPAAVAGGTIFSLKKEEQDCTKTATPVNGRSSSATINIRSPSDCQPTSRQLSNEGVPQEGENCHCDCENHLPIGVATPREVQTPASLSATVVTPFRIKAHIICCAFIFLCLLCIYTMSATASSSYKASAEITIYWCDYLMLAFVIGVALDIFVIQFLCILLSVLYRYITQEEPASSSDSLDLDDEDFGGDKKEVNEISMDPVSDLKKKKKSSHRRWLQSELHPLEGELRQRFRY